MRIAGMVIMACGMLLLLGDLHLTGGETGYRPSALGALWHEWDAPSLNLLQAITERYILPQLWSHVLLPLLLSPAWMVAVILGAALIALTLKSKRNTRLKEHPC